MKADYFYTRQWLYWEDPDDKLVMPAAACPTKPAWELIAARLNHIHSKFFEEVFKIA